MLAVENTGYIVIGSIIGLLCLIGSIYLGVKKDRVLLGVLLGLFCGVIGLIIMVFVPPSERAR